eukprot:UN25870
MSNGNDRDFFYKNLWPNFMPMCTPTSERGACMCARQTWHDVILIPTFDNPLRGSVHPSFEEVLLSLCFLPKVCVCEKKFPRLRQTRIM